MARVREALRKLAQMDPEEPVFVLRGQDILAPEVVLYWAQLAEVSDVSPSRKIAEAREWARVMEKWEPRKLPD